MVVQNIIDGRKIFQLMDTYGFPLECIVLELRRRGLGFNVPQFIEATEDSQNFSREKIEQGLLSCLPREHYEDVKKELIKIRR